ncbi:MAG: HD domain-containing protein [Lachnospiraceae bacterium]|jgi:metal-dependent HD superfamily phosphatase/phosphodiesterase|nr:HD domain-containing protein [Lachnospiraceae bacterium]
MRILYKDITQNEKIRIYIEKADQSLLAMGYTEHSFAHVRKVAETAGEILRIQGFDEREIELACIAGYLHDIGNVVNRVDHAQSGAVMAFRILDQMNGDPGEIATIVTAIGNHDEATAFPVNPVAAALILADKTDVRCTRVRNQDGATFDIHDRVNFSVKDSHLQVERDQYIELQLAIDTQVCAVMDYFEIFLGRMILCRKAAEKLGLQFRLTINGQRMM